MICVVIKGPSLDEARRQITQALSYAELVELRLDLFHELEMQGIKRLREEFSLPMIFTLRSNQQGGQYRYSEERRLKDLLQLANLKPDYLDLEYHVPLNLIEEIGKRYPEIRLILSYHNFSMTPGDLEALCQEMRKVPAYFYKIAVTAQDAVDAMRLCCWAKQTGGKVIAISMGPHGQISRILSPIIGSPITYASLEEGMQSAPGQLSAQLLLSRYHYRSLNSQTAIYGLIGDPVDKSISDETHNALMQQLKLDAIYVKVAVKPEQLSEFIPLAKQLPFKGLSVTMPLKEHILPFMDQLDDEALKIGAVNTLKFENRNVAGYNTDGLGALNAIEQVCPVKGKKIVIVGAGGAAKAIIFEALKRGAQVTILNRDREKAQGFATQFGCQAKGLEQMESCAREGYDILINSTPIAMPIKEQDILPQAVVMDIKTRPKEVELLSHAKQKGCPIIYGYKMFIEQAIGQYAIWFNHSLDPHQCRQILEHQASQALQ